MPNHLIEPEELMAYLDGELPPSRSTAAADHLEHCRECQDLAADFESVSRRMLAWQVEPTADTPAPELDEALAACPPPIRETRRRSTATTAWKWIAGVAAAITLVILVSPNHPVEHDQKEARNALTSYNEAASPAPAPPAPATATTVAPQIARSAQLTVTVRDVDQARAAMEDILKRHNGYLGELTTHAPSGESHSLEATLRIPADHLTLALAELKKLGHVESESQSGEEVTQQAVDLDARLENSRNTEQRLTALLRQQSGQLADVLQVETEISRVRGEIERLESERKALSKRVEYATVNVTLTEDYTAKLAPNSSAARFRNAAVEGFRNLLDSLSGLAIFLLAYGPTLLLWAAILYFPARFAWKRVALYRGRLNQNNPPPLQ